MKIGGEPPGPLVSVGGLFLFALAAVGIGSLVGWEFWQSLYARVWHILIAVQAVIWVAAIFAVIGSVNELARVVPRRTAYLFAVTIVSLAAFPIATAALTGQRAFGRFSPLPSLKGLSLF